MKFPESALAHKYLDGLSGVEVGGSAHNPWGLKTLNIDFCDRLDTVFKQDEIKMCGHCLAVDIVAEGDALPLRDSSVDFVVSSHVLEHAYDTIGMLQEWIRVVRPGGIVFIIVPKRDADTNDAKVPINHFQEVADRHLIPATARPPQHRGHWVVLDLPLLVRICAASGLEIVEAHETDDKAKNGHMIVCRVKK